MSAGQPVLEIRGRYVFEFGRATQPIFDIR